MKRISFMTLYMHQQFILVALIFSLIYVTTPEITLLVGCLYSSVAWSFSNEKNLDYNLSIWISFVIITFFQVLLSNSSAIFYLACTIYTTNLVRNLYDMYHVSSSRIHVLRIFSYLTAIFLSLYLEPSVKQILIPLLIVLIINKSAGRIQHG